MPDGKKDIPGDELACDTRGDKPSAPRLKTKGGFNKIDAIGDEVSDALDRAFDDFTSDTGRVDDGWLTFKEITASAPSESTFNGGIRTPLRPPPQGLIIDSKRGDSEKPPALPISTRAEARAREQAIASKLREKRLAEERADEAERLAQLLKQYVDAELTSATPSISMIRQKGAESLDVDFFELHCVAHGEKGVFDRIDFQALFRRLSEKYGVERFDTYLLSFLRLQQPLAIPRLGNDSKNWHISARAVIETPSPEAPPRILLFKMDSTSEGKKIRHQHVELVYILQGLSLVKPT